MVWTPHCPCIVCSLRGLPDGRAGLADGRTAGRWLPVARGGATGWVHTGGGKGRLIFLYSAGEDPGFDGRCCDGSVTKRLLSSTVSKAHGSASCYGMDGALCASASPCGGQCPLSSPRVLHS